MRVCLVTIAAGGVGGMQKHTRDLATGLVRAGHEVDLIAPDSPEGCGETIDERIRWRTVDSPADFQSRTWLDRSCEEFARADAERSFDVVHGEGSSALGLVLRGMHRRVPLVTMFHGVYLGLARASLSRARGGGRLAGALEEARFLVHLSRIHFARGNWYRFRPFEIIVPSYFQVADTRRSHLLDPARIHVVPNGIDAELFSPRPREARATPLLVAGGRFDQNKGFHVAIEAMTRLDARLVVSGRGEQWNSLRRLVDHLGVEEKVSLPGDVPLEERARLVASADAYLFPTLEYEASGLALLEAMSCGVPVIASDISAVREAVSRPGENGLIVPPGDPEALAEAVGALLADGDLRRRIGIEARSRILEQYTIEQMTRKTLEVYELAVGAFRNGAAAA